MDWWLKTGSKRDSEAKSEWFGPGNKILVGTEISKSAAPHTLTNLGLSVSIRT